MINTIIVEDDRIIQNYLFSMLANDGRFRIVGRYADAFDAESACSEGTIDLVLMDVQTSHNHSGLAAGERSRASRRLPSAVTVPVCRERTV